MAKRHREDGDERPEESNVDLERETPCMSSQETQESICQQLFEKEQET